MKILNIKLAVLLLLLASIVSSCSGFKDSNDYSTDEFNKDLSGKWTIGQASRNGLDITKAMDFSAFMITFNADKTYKIDNYLPFVVRKNGTWDIDDPQYPAKLTFKEESSQSANVSTIEYLIVNGERQITLSFVPGCHNNVYTYVLKRVTN